jgi:hypothetical protein
MHDTELSPTPTAKRVPWNKGKLPAQSRRSGQNMSGPFGQCSRMIASARSSAVQSGDRQQASGL